MFGTHRYQGLRQEKEFITASGLQPISYSVTGISVHITLSFMENQDILKDIFGGLLGEAVKNNCSMTYSMWKNGGKKKGILF